MDPHAFGSTLEDKWSEGKKDDEAWKETQILVEEVWKAEIDNVWTQWKQVFKDR